jgi:uncharacterized protein (UPF0548 family)
MEPAVRAFVDAQRSLQYTYPEVGATAAAPPARSVVDRTRVKLGEGEAAFAAGRAALARWEQFRLGWVEPLAPAPAIQAGEVVAIGIWIAGVWWLNASRIVYVVDEFGPTTRFGFAYGTLPGHAESGEERFLAEWDRATDEVWYSILAFSRPRHGLARLGKPLVRRMQRRFGRESAAAMVRAVEKELSQRR